jgi:hypothetical protein
MGARDDPHGDPARALLKGKTEIGFEPDDHDAPDDIDNMTGDDR